MTKPQIHRITLPTPHGEAEAIRDHNTGFWQIGYPWGDDRFHGTRTQVTARMLRTILKHQQQESSQ
jgi:hypothetical protein